MAPTSMQRFCRFPQDGREKVYLVGASLKSEGSSGRSGDGSSYGIEESLEELGRLADTAGCKVGSPS